MLFRSPARIVLVLAPPLTILAGLGAATLWDGVRVSVADRAARTASVLGAVLAGMLALTTLPFIAFETTRWIKLVVGASSKEQYLDGFGAPGSEYRTAQFLLSHSALSDSVLVWGMNTGVLPMSGRRSFSRFGFYMPLMSAPTPVVRRYDDEFRSELSSRRPRFVVAGEPHGEFENPERNPLDLWVRSILTSEYTLRIDAGKIKVYERSGDRSP